MRVTAATVVVAAGLVASAVGCSSLSGLSSGSNNNNGVVMSEDPTNGSGSSPSDAILQGERTGAYDDGGASSVGPGEATWCSSVTATFCSDFDRGLASGWTSPGSAHGETRLIAGGTSAPNSLAAITEPVGTGVVARAFLHKDFTTSASEELTFSFSVRIEQIGATLGKGGTIAVISVGDLPNYYELQLNVFSDGIARVTERSAPKEDGGSAQYVERTLAGTLPIGVWKRVTLRLDYSGATAFTVAVDEDAITVPTSVSLPKTPPRIYLGVTYVDPPSARWDVRYDDVTMVMR